jgi:hypothetical protein
MHSLPPSAERSYEDCGLRGNKIKSRRMIVPRDRNAFVFRVLRNYTPSTIIKTFLAFLRSSMIAAVREQIKHMKESRGLSNVPSLDWPSRY